MRNERRPDEELEFADAELCVVTDFLEAARDGKRPKIDEYLGRAPGSEAKLRPILETAVRLCAEFAMLRAENPGVDLAALLDPEHFAKGG